MAIQLSGLGGFDSASVVDQLVQVANQPLKELDTKKALVDQASSTLTLFSNRLSTLKANATALSTPSGFTSMAATSSDGAIVPSVTGSATASSYAISVTQLAKAQKTRSDSQASATTALGMDGDFTIKVGNGQTYTVAVKATDTLSDLASKIGQSGARVTAGIINTGSGYRLSVQGVDSGAANAITFGQTGTVALGFEKPANAVEPAQDALLTVDGLAISRPTNQISEAIPGVTLALTKTTTSPVTLGVAGDSSSLKTKISSFVSAYNDIVNAGHTASGYGTTKASNSVLRADPAIRRSLDKIASVVTGLVPGSTGNYRSLSSIGISVNRDGIMSFDGAKLDAALQKDPSAVQRLFVTDAATGATGMMKTLADSVNALITGDGAAVKGRIDALGAQSRRITDSRAAKEVRVARYEQQLKKQFSELDIAMSRYQSMSSTITGMSSG